jgi:hypothetical protein
MIPSTNQSGLASAIQLTAFSAGATTIPGITVPFEGTSMESTIPSKATNSSGEGMRLNLRGSLSVRMNSLGKPLRSANNGMQRSVRNIKMEWLRSSIGIHGLE